MRFLSASFLLISFLLLITFGFSGACIETGGCCSFILGKQVPCPHDNPVGFINFHFESLKILGIAVLILGIWGLHLKPGSFFILFSNSFLFSGKYFLNKKEVFPPIEQGLNYWLALHEKRDPVFVA